MEPMRDEATTERARGTDAPRRLTDARFRELVERFLVEREEAAGVLRFGGLVKKDAPAVVRPRRSRRRSTGLSRPLGRIGRTTRLLTRRSQSRGQRDEPAHDEGKPAPSVLLNPSLQKVRVGLV